MLNVPLSFTSGDRIIWFDENLAGINLDTGAQVSFTPPQFTLSYAFRGASYFDITAITDGQRFKSVIDSNISAALDAGVCNWQAYIIDQAGDRTTIGAGQSLVLTNLALASTAPLSQVQTLQAQLDKVNAAIDARLTGNAVVEYEINGRKLKYVPLPDLTALRDTLKKELFRAQSAERVAMGKNPRRRLIRFDPSAGPRR
jgi:hypothetical protein